jgi:4-amino-4-deoxy-L-arabinose transferase-like glycosyltransferase
MLKTATWRFRRSLARTLATRLPVSTRAKWLMAISIFMLAFVTRSLQAVDLASVMYTTAQPFSGLTVIYDARAANILEGGGLLGPYQLNPGETMWLAEAPGYAIYLSAIYSVAGRDFFAVQMVQNALSSFAPVLLFLLVGSFLSWRVGLMSGLLAALSHHLAHISNFILPDSLCALPILAAMVVLVIAQRQRRHAYWLYGLVGVLIGMAAWLRAQPMLFGPFLFVLLVLIAKRRLSVAKRAAVTALLAVLIIAPITIRNYLVYDAFLPISIGAGLNLWEGLADASGDRYGAVAKDEEVAAQEAVLYDKPEYGGAWHTPDGIARDRDRVKKSLAIIRAHPVWYAGVMFHRMGEMMKYSAHAPLVYRIAEAQSQERTAPVRKEWRAIAPAGASLQVGESLFWLRPVIRPLQRLAKETMLGFILVGALLLFVASWRRALFISIVPLYYFAFQSFIHTEFRYTLPMQYFLFVFAAIVWTIIGGMAWQAVKRALYKIGWMKAAG